MNRFLRLLRMSMTISGIIAELVPAISSEFSKREQRNLAVVKTTAAVQSHEKQDSGSELVGSEKSDPNLT